VAFSGIWIGSGIGDGDEDVDGDIVHGRYNCNMVTIKQCERYVEIVAGHLNLHRHMSITQIIYIILHCLA
jgi:hypothetical protein